VSPSTCQPACTSKAALKELSTPPERPTATRCSPGQARRRSIASAVAGVAGVAGVAAVGREELVKPDDLKAETEQN